MKIAFRIDENYLIAHTLSSISSDRFSSNKNKKDIINFQNFAWKKSQEVYSFIIGNWIPETDKKINKLPKYLTQLKKSSAFKRILLQTKKYLEFCKNQWNKNYIKSYKNIKEITGLKFNDNFTVYITHPSLKNGIYLGNSKIAWGHNEDWKNYTTIYLWHEILHSYMPKDEIAHSLIELVADEELRIKLNKGRYFSIGCHPELKSIKKKLMHLWKKYLKQKDKNIKKFYNKVKK